MRSLRFLSFCGGCKPSDFRVFAYNQKTSDFRVFAYNKMTSDFGVLNIITNIF